MQSVYTNVLTYVRTPCNDSHMTTKTQELWITTSKNGQVGYYYFSTRAFRAFRMARAEAELMLATGGAVLVTKPDWVG